MKRFTGFPAKMQFTPIPNFFFSSLLLQINDIVELKTTLHVLRALYRKRSYPRFVTYGELLANKSLMDSFRETAESPKEALRETLEMVIQRGTFIHIVLDRNGVPEDIYFLNSDYDRQIVA